MPLPCYPDTDGVSIARQVTYISAMDIRRAKLSDAGRISDLVTSLSYVCQADGCSNMPQWFIQTLDEKAFLQRLSGSEYVHFVAVADEKIIGYVALSVDGRLYHLFVEKEYQGRGISRLLWESARSECPLNYYFLRSSLEAVPVYIAFGFVKKGGIEEKQGVQYQPMELHLI